MKDLGGTTARARESDDGGGPRPGSAGASTSDDHGPRLPYAGLGVLSHAESGGIPAFMIGSMLVEEIDGGEGAMTGSAVRSFDAVPLPPAAGAHHREPAGLVLRHNQQGTGGDRQEGLVRVRREAPTPVVW